MTETGRASVPAGWGGTTPCRQASFVRVEKRVYFYCKKTDVILPFLLDCQYLNEQKPLLFQYRELITERAGYIFAIECFAAIAAGISLLIREKQ